MHPLLKLSLANNNPFFDETVALLLRYVDETQSVRAAGEAVGISYSNAWNKIKLLENELGCTVINRTQGGAVGCGRSELTEKGRSLLLLYNDFYVKMLSDMEKRFHDTFDDVFTREIYLICAGEECSADARQYRYYAPSELPLSDLGKLTSCLMWRELSGKRIVTAFTSDSTAAMQTGEIVFGSGCAAVSFEDVSPAERFAELLDSAVGNCAVIAEKETLSAIAAAMPCCEGIAFRKGSYCVLSEDGGLHLSESNVTAKPDLGRILCKKILHTFCMDENSISKVLKNAELKSEEAFLSGADPAETESAEILKSLERELGISELLEKTGYTEIANAVRK